MQLRGEQRVRESGVPYTVVRPGRFVGKPDGASVKLKAAQGDTINGSIDPVDVAAICVAALRDHAAIGVTFEVCPHRSLIACRSRCQPLSQRQNISVSFTVLTLDKNLPAVGREGDVPEGSETQADATTRC